MTGAGLAWLRLTALSACLGAAALYYASGQLHHDPSFLLIATKRWLHGAVLYQDIMEINPPLIFYLTAPSVMISELLHVSSASVFIVLICALAGVSIAWCWVVLSRVETLSLGWRYLIISACFLGLVLAPAYNFGQREQVFIVLALPYLLALGLSPLGPRFSAIEKAGLGLLAVVGIALKPYFLLPALLLTLALSWQQRSFRPWVDPANLSIGAGCLAYLLFVAVFHRAYFDPLIPMGLLVYDAIATDTANVLLRSILPLVLIVTIATIASENKPVRSALLALSAAALGLLMAFVAQRKIWDYQLLPFESMAVVLATTATALTWRQASSRHLTILAAVSASILIVPMSHGRYTNPYAEVIGARLKSLEPGWPDKSILVLSTNVSAAFPLINGLDAEWAGRYPYQWLIAGALTRESATSRATEEALCAEIQSIIDYARRTNVDDFEFRRPDVVLIDERKSKSYMPASDFDYVAFLNKDPRFSALWKQHYSRVDNVLDYSVWIRLAPMSNGLGVKAKAAPREG